VEREKEREREKYYYLLLERIRFTNYKIVTGSLSTAETITSADKAGLSLLNRLWSIFAIGVKYPLSQFVWPVSITATPACVAERMS
jgi:hypothetical protein